MNALNRFASAYFSLILLGSCLLAFFVPAPGASISWTILLALFTIIFATFFRFELDPVKMKPDLRKAGSYVFLRFLLLPLTGYLLLFFISPFYAFATFFLLLMPAAVSSPAFTSLFGARINLSMLILILSSFFSILTISFLTPLFYQGTAHIGIGRFLFTLLVSIPLPFLLHLPMRQYSAFSRIMVKNIPVITVIALSSIFVLAISGNRQVILDHPSRIFVYLTVSVVLYAGMYIIGWLFGTGKGLEQKITFSVSSGMNNIGLAVSLATLYLPGDLCIFLITAEFAWVGILLPLRLLWKKVPDRLSTAKQTN
jgi:predicted Na+-dependent transporter